MFEWSKPVFMSGSSCSSLEEEEEEEEAWKLKAVMIIFRLMDLQTITAQCVLLHVLGSSEHSTVN